MTESLALEEEKASSTASGWLTTKPGRAVVANDKTGNGIVLWAVGDVAQEVEDISPMLQDVGLNDAPVGVSVWEGNVHWFQSGWETPEWEAELKGVFRAPTEEEWGAIRRGLSPWDKNEWLIEEAREDSTAPATIDSGCQFD